MDRFEGARDAAAKKYTFMERPEGAAQEKADVAVDALATLIGAYIASVSSRASCGITGGDSEAPRLQVLLHSDIRSALTCNCTHQSLWMIVLAV
jgi:hypothetical protein